MKFSKRTIITAIAFTVLGTALALAQMHQALPQPEITLNADVVTVPMDMASGLPVVQLTINGKGPYAFVVDTGAAGTVLSDSLAQELALESSGEVQVHSPMGDHPLPGKLVRIDRLEMGQAVLSNLFAVSFDASRVFNKPGAPRGVLSANSFPGYLLTFNYPQSKIELSKGELPAADNKEILEFDASGPLVSIPVRIGEIEVQAHLDSGSVEGIMLPGKYAKLLPLSGELTKGETRHTVDATVEHQKGTLKGALQVGGISIQNPEIMFNDRAQEGNLGTGFLSHFVVTLDRKNHRIRLKES